jgi:hypothetical protein
MTTKDGQGRGDSQRGLMASAVCPWWEKGFYEWKKGSCKEMQPHLIRMKGVAVVVSSQSAPSM